MIILSVFLTPSCNLFQFVEKLNYPIKLRIEKKIFLYYLWLFCCIKINCLPEDKVLNEITNRPVIQPNTNLDWRDQIIYQLMVDRFADGDPNNNYNVELNSPGRYHGGDWQGIIDHLDYLQELGVTAIWISPVVKNVEEDAGFASYHGYWTQDFLSPNPHFGDLAKLREMVDEIHARGMYVILDIVTNHVGQLFYYDINGNGRPDETLIGAGNNHICREGWWRDPNYKYHNDIELYCNNVQLERITEYDPDYDPRGIQGWTSLGESGLAEIRWLYMPEINRLPPLPPEFQNPEWYNRRGRVYVWGPLEYQYNRDFVREQEMYGDFPGGLKDLNTDRRDVQEALIKVYTYWIDVGDFDGFRIDTLKHIDRPECEPGEPQEICIQRRNTRGFWGEFCTRIREHCAQIGKHNFFMFGEAFDGRDYLIGAYTFGGQDERGKFGRLDSVFYFSQKFRVFDNVFKYNAPTTEIERLFNERQQNYYDQPHASPQEGGIGLPPNKVLVNFMDNHDLPRFLFDMPDVKALHNALFFLLTWDGIPCIYYGTEQEFDGGNDPKNREDLFLGNVKKGYPPFDTTNRTFQYIRELITLRKQYASLRRGEVIIRWSSPRTGDEIDAGIFAFERVYGNERVLVVLNTNNNHVSRTEAPDTGDIMQTGFPPGTILKDIAPGSDGKTFTVNRDGKVVIDVPPRGGRILVP